MEIWKSQKRGFPHFHRLGGYDDKNEVPNPKNRTESVKYVPGLKCKTCPRLDKMPLKKIKHKVPHPYSRADESARSLTGIRDDVANFDFSVRERNRAGEGACAPQS